MLKDTTDEGICSTKALWGGLDSTVRNISHNSNIVNEATGGNQVNQGAFSSRGDAFYGEDSLKAKCCTNDRGDDDDDNPPASSPRLIINFSILKAFPRRSNTCLQPLGEAQRKNQSASSSSVYRQKPGWSSAQTHRANRCHFIRRVFSSSPFLAESPCCH